MRKLIYEISKSMPGVRIEELNIQNDHVHIFAVIPPKYAVANVVGRLKGGTAHVFRERYKLFKTAYREKDVMWSPGYFASTVGIDEEIIRRYVKYQQALDAGQAKLDL